MSDIIRQAQDWSSCQASVARLRQSQPSGAPDVHQDDADDLSTLVNPLRAWIPEY